MGIRSFEMSSWLSRRREAPLYLQCVVKLIVRTLLYFSMDTELRNVELAQPPTRGSVVSSMCCEVDCQCSIIVDGDGASKCRAGSAADATLRCIFNVLSSSLSVLHSIGWRTTFFSNGK